MATRIVYFGTPEDSVYPLEYLIKMGIRIAGVYTQPDRLAGRGRRTQAPPVKVFAQNNKLDVVQPKSLRSREVVSQLESIAPDLIVVAAYGQFLPKEVLRVPRFGCLNIHPSMLPKYRGPSPVATAIRNGDSMTGVTIIMVDQGMDSGPILAQEEEAVFPKDTTLSLSHRLFTRGAELMVKVLPRYLQGELDLEPQQEENATFSKKLTKNDGAVDWSLPAESLQRQIKAYTPWPGTFTLWEGRMLKIVDAIAMTALPGGNPGEVVSIKGNHQTPLGIITGDGMLGVLEIQLAGRAVTGAASFVAGYSQMIGQRLPS
jgi:methionyl-tRNA formyltransferase